MRINNPNKTSPNNFFGYGVDGNFESKDTVTYLDVPDDDGPCYYFFKNFILHEGHTLTTTRACRGLYIYVSNTAIIDGTITMTDRGIYSPPEGEYENGYIPLGMGDIIGSNFRSSMSLPGKGKLSAGGWTKVLTTQGGTGGTYDITNGEKNLYGGCGGGGCGDPSAIYWRSGEGGTGGIAGVFSSGSGGSGSILIGGAIRECISGGAAQDYGGYGGTANYAYYGTAARSGRGNPTKTLQYPLNSSSLTFLPNLPLSGTAGVLYCVCNKIKLSTKCFQSIGKDNNNVTTTNVKWYSGSYSSYPAGGAGGGSITALYRIILNPDIIPTCADVSCGHQAGEGSIRIYQIL